LEAGSLGRVPAEFEGWIVSGGEADEGRNVTLSLIIPKKRKYQRLSLRN